MNAKTVFVTGANRGLGLQFVKEILKLELPPKTLIATCREPENAKELNEIAATNASVKILKLDVAEDVEGENLERVLKDVDQLLEGEGLNLLINNAGRNSKQRDPLSKANLTQDFTTNVFAPLLLTNALQPYLEKGAAQSTIPGLNLSKAGVVNISSIMASVKLNTSGGHVSYKASKAALNMVTSVLANELKRKGVVCIAMHPGWVQTDMGGPNASISAIESVNGMLRVFAKCDDIYNGKFLQYSGEELPW